MTGIPWRVVSRDRGATLPGTCLSRSESGHERGRYDGHDYHAGLTDQGAGMKIPRPLGTEPLARWTTCPECGQAYEADDSRRGHCLDCEAVLRREWDRYREVKRGRAAGYDSRWDRLSRRARRLQPFCSDCGTTEDLTADHTTTAWARKDAGLPIRLRDIDVVCLRCNSERGPARGPNASDDHRPDRAARLEREIAEWDDDPWGEGAD